MQMRTKVAQPIVLLLVLSAGCGSSHGRGDDTGAGDAATDTAADASSDARVDTGGPIDGGVATCVADDAASIICADIVCDEGPRWYWNGDSCFPVECGTCTGEDCERGAFEESECIGSHAACEASLCRDTGGSWRWWSEECEHWRCGFELPAACEEGRAVCDCGAYRSFDPESGCHDDDTCPIAEPISDEELCGVTGGSWEGICCHAECGVPCGDGCVNPACNCGPTKVFDPARGCVESSRCYERNERETCEGVARCEGGTICCQDCGGAGCVGPPTCRFPLCDEDETIDMCGNNLLAP